MKCPRCGAEVQPGEVFCGECGARMPPAAPPQKGPPIVPIVIGVLVVLVACCLGSIVLILIGAISLPLLTPPTPTPTPTATPTPSPTPTATPTPTPTPTATPTPTPAPTETAPPSPTRPVTVDGMKVYTSDKHGFSIHYPADWLMTESASGPVFSSARTVAGVAIGVIPGANLLGDEKALVNHFVTSLQTQGTFKDVAVLSEDTRTFNGVEWRYLVITSSYSGMKTKWDLYAKIHTTGTGYVFIGFAVMDSYDQVTQTFTEMMESFEFLP